jgi:Domain of unknown function (DUF4391)
MTPEQDIMIVVEALALPPEARIDRRVPKKLLIEQGAPTVADKRAIQDGIDELQWLAVLKPTTIAVPTFRDDAREYLEIAVVAIAFRAAAKSARLTELVHRAIPYPVVLITSDPDGIAMSVAHKRRAQNEPDKVVVERVVEVRGIHPDQPSGADRAFLDNLKLSDQPRQNLHALYEGWLARIEALAAARLSGAFIVSDETNSIARRREALEAHSRLTRTLAALSAKAAREKQMNRRVDLNLEIQRLEAEIATHKANL